MVNSGSLPKLKMEFFVIMFNSIAKSPVLDVPGVSGYTIVICFWLQCRCTSLMTGNFSPENCFCCFLCQRKHMAPVRPRKDKLRLMTHSAASLS